MNKKISTTLLALALMGSGAQAATFKVGTLPYKDFVNGSSESPQYTNEETIAQKNLMLDKLLPTLIAPLADIDKSTPYDESKDCLLVPIYEIGHSAPACQIVLQSGDYLPVKRGHSRFFIDTPDGQLGPFATGNLMGAPVAQPYPRLVDDHEVKHAQVHENR